MEKGDVRVEWRRGCEGGVEKGEGRCEGGEGGCGVEWRRGM